MSGGAGEAVTVRLARRGDVPAIWELERDFAAYEKLTHEFTGSAEALAAHLFDGAPPRLDAFVAERAGRVIGFAITYFCFSSFWTKPILWLEDVYVDPAHRGSGAGKALMRAVAAHAVASGAPRVDWAVLEWNALAIEFYESLGAFRTGGWHPYRIEGEALQRLAAGEQPASDPRHE
jgi:ribosomal protein S18 acetylase RimI-like enzyme